MKGLVNLTYEVSPETFFKHKALWITKPSWNLTGEYTCHVQTFQSSDKRTAKLQFIGKITFRLDISLDIDRFARNKLIFE